MVIALATALTSCGDREGSVKAALALAEAIYPGQLELYEARMAKDHYDVVLAIKGDPITRITLAVDNKPAVCRVGTACETRLRRSYDTGVKTAELLKSVDHALRSCNMPPLALETRQGGWGTFVLEMDLDVADQKAGLDALAGCIANFRKNAGEDLRARDLHFRILRRAATGAAAVPARLTFEDNLPAKREGEPSYLLDVSARDVAIPVTKLRLSPNYIIKSGLDKKLGDVARSVLATHADGAGMPPLPFLDGTRLDANRLDIFRTYVLACSSYKPGSGPCEYDLAVRMTYDLTRAQASDMSVLKIQRSPRGSLDLPAIPGR